MYKHRSEGKCDCTELVIDTSYCITCKCIVAGCGRPRHKSDFCFQHRRVVKKAPFQVQLAVAAVPVASLLMPCDIVDFLSASVILQDDLAMIILTAAIKEPLAVAALVEAWKQMPAQYSGSDLRTAVLRKPSRQRTGLLIVRSWPSCIAKECVGSSASSRLPPT